MNFNNVAIVFVKGNNYMDRFWYMSNGEVVNVLRNANLTEKIEYYKT